MKIITVFQSQWNVKECNITGLHKHIVVECNQEVKLLPERIDAVVDIFEEKVWSASG
ncbi:MAG: hypothetical protein JRE58_09545 [Deltaproteobacteria bacterium]|nr:hypothetical protein [Deltaproteobacteria bacterium]